jgi:hypothetical protein
VSLVLRAALFCAQAILAATMFVTAAQAQPMTMPMPPPPNSAATAPTTPPSNPPPQNDNADMQDMDMTGMDMGDEAMMAGALGTYSMMRDASGTSWQPDSTPMEGFTGAFDGWSTMLHGYILGVYDDQTGPRGGKKTFSESMLMGMAQRQLGIGTLTLRTMLSLDPFMGKNGYPLLLQTGETADGVHPLVDRQHPHNLFMELAGTYSVPVRQDISTFVYLGYPGEPALGPTTFMHRFSGMDDPAAPITHHWLDSTHITFGVLTAGIIDGDWKLEGSLFNGREPDQYRWGFDDLRFDSGSARLTWNATSNWSAQVSYGFIKSPEQLEPNINQHRLTASATYNLPLEHGNWQTTFAWGRNSEQPGPTLDGLLLESAVSWYRHTVFARVENVQKDDLFQPPSPFAGDIVRVSELSLGYVYDIPIFDHLAAGIGGVGTVDFVPSTIAGAYGSANPVSFMAFLRLKTI